MWIWFDTFFFYQRRSIIMYFWQIYSIDYESFMRYLQERNLLKYWREKRVQSIFINHFINFFNMLFFIICGYIDKQNKNIFRIVIEDRNVMKIKWKTLFHVNKDFMHIIWIPKHATQFLLELIKIVHLKLLIKIALLDTFAQRIQLLRLFATMEHIWLKLIKKVEIKSLIINLFDNINFYKYFTHKLYLKN